MNVNKTKTIIAFTAPWGTQNPLSHTSLHFFIFTQYFSKTDETDLPLFFKKDLAIPKSNPGFVSEITIFCQIFKVIKRRCLKQVKFFCVQMLREYIFLILILRLVFSLGNLTKVRVIYTQCLIEYQLKNIISFSFGMKMCLYELLWVNSSYSQNNFLNNVFHCSSLNNYQCKITLKMFLIGSQSPSVSNYNEI